MNHDAEKVWFGQSINQGAINRAAEAIQRTGKALPCVVTAVSGSFVTVQFEVNSTPWVLPPITIPKAEGPWIRSPTQVGDYGMTVPADAYLTAISGQGGGTPDLTQPGNLAALAWVPVASKNFSVVDINKVNLIGPNGVLAQTQDGTASITVEPGQITFTAGGKTVTINSSGITIDGILWETHVHSGVQSGGSDTGPPV